MSDENKKEPITINLDTLESTDVLERKNLIFQDQFDLLVKKIRRKAKENRDKLENLECRETPKQDDEARGVPSCFFIDGTRGSGKSTLMRAVRDALVKGKFKENEENKICLYSLADVDPTELGKGENFFLYLLARIYRLLDESFKKRDERDDKVEQIRGAMEALRKMSGGLQVLMDSDGALKESDNPDFFLEKCVDKCADSTLLRKKLCELLGEVAKIVGKEIFLVTIDDADLNFSKCEDVLEYVRKYMQTPRLIFLFAGDMQLYSHIVRGMHIDNFSKKQLRFDSSHEDHRFQMLEQLEEQYMLKLFPVDYRVQTHGLRKILEGKREVLIKRNKYDSDKEGIHWYLSKYLLSKVKMGAREGFIDAILQLPMRSLLFLLRYLTKNPYGENDTRSLKYIWEGIQEVFLPALVKYNVDYMQLGSANVEGLQKTLFRYCASVQRWSSDLSMIPTEVDSGAKHVSLYLGGEIGLSTQRLSSKLIYWCACFPVWQSIREFYTKNHDVWQTRSFVETCLKQGNGGSKSTWANLACSAMAPDMSSPVLYGRGTICLLNEDRLQNKEKGWDYRKGMKSLIPDLLHSKAEFTLEERRYIQALNVSLCRLDDESGSYFYLSIYHLLMNIAEWLEVAAQNQQGERDSNIVESVDIWRANLRMAILKEWTTSCTAPNLLRMHHVAAKQTRQPSSEQLSHTFEFSTDDDFASEMVAWAEEYVNVSFVTSSKEFSRSWEIFLARCGELTAIYKSKYKNEEECPKAGEIFRKYMQAVEEAFADIKEGDASNLAKCISNFPLWKILKEPSAACAEVEHLLNLAFIGDFINLEQQETMAQSKNDYKLLLSEFSNKENERQEHVQKMAKSDSLLRELIQQKNEAEVSMKLRKSKLEIGEKSLSEKRAHIKELMQEEETDERMLAMLQRSEQEMNDKRRECSQKCRIVERVMNAAESDNMAHSILSEEIEKEQRLLDQSRSEVLRNRHEITLNLMQNVMSLLVNNGNAQNFKAVAHEVQLELKKSEMHYRRVCAQLESQKGRIRLIRKQRLIEEKELADMTMRHEEYLRQSFDAEIAYEIASLKHAHMLKEVEEMRNHLNELDNALSQAQILCDTAKKKYEDAMKPDEVK